MTIPTIYANQDYSPTLYDNAITEAEASNTGVTRNSLLGAGIGAGSAGLLGSHMVGSDAVAEHSAKALGPLKELVAKEHQALNKLKQNYSFMTPNMRGSHTGIDPAATLLDKLKTTGVVTPGKFSQYMVDKANMLEATHKRIAMHEAANAPSLLKKIRSDALKKLLSTGSGKIGAGAVLAGGAGLGYLANKVLSERDQG